MRRLPALAAFVPTLARRAVTLTIFGVEEGSRILGQARCDDGIGIAAHPAHS